MARNELLLNNTFIGKNTPNMDKPDPVEIPNSLTDELSFYLPAEIQNLTSQLRTNKLFLNMVVHDLRNPTVSIKIGME